MQITITITDADWEQFQAVAQEAVEQSWDGNYEDFATYIMAVNLETYIKAQQKKQEKKLKRALLVLEQEQAAKEPPVPIEKPQTPLLSPKQPETALLAKKADTSSEEEEGEGHDQSRAVSTYCTFGRGSCQKANAGPSARVT